MNNQKLILILIVGFLSYFYGKAEDLKSNKNVLNPDSLLEYPFPTLTDAFKALGFDPSAKENSFFVVTADLHYSSEDGEHTSMLTIVDEVNKMHPSPAFFCVDGDMIRSASHSFGECASPEERKDAINEFKAFKADADLLNKKIQLVLAIGNHDTNAKEIDPEIFWEVFPDFPPYQSFNLSGIHIIVLNGHSCGYIDKKQMEWLLKDISKISKDQTVIVFVHQPSISHITRERGIPEAISETFKNHRGLVWLIGGHEHANFEKIFQLQKTKLIEHGITTGTFDMWGGPERPGYWIYCLQNGKVAGRIYRKLETGYRLEAQPNLSNAQKVHLPFDHIKNIVWKGFAGAENEEKYLVHLKGGICHNWWSYVKELTYRLPLKETGNSCTKIAMLCDYKKMDKIYNKGQYYLSSDQQNWREIKLENNEFETFSFVIPQYLLQSKYLYFKFTPLGETHVGGFALLK